MLPVAQTPLIYYPLRWLRDGGVRNVTVCANSSTGVIRERLGDGAHLSMSIDYYADHAPRGAAGCVRDAGSVTDAQTFIAIEGAVIPSVDLAGLLAAHRQSGAAATVVVDVDRRRNAITSERPRTPGGIYVFDRRVFDAIPALGFQDIKESLIQRLYQAGERVVTHEVPGVSPRVMSYETYTAVNRWLVARMVERPELMEGYVPVGEGLRHHSASVDPRARVVGPVLLGPGSRVMEGAVLVGPTTIGADSCVGREALVSRCVVWSRCTIGDGALVDDCLLTDDVTVVRGEHVTGSVRMHDATGARNASITTLPTAEPARAGSDALTAVPSLSWEGVR